MDSFSHDFDGATAVESPNGTRTTPRTTKPRVHLDPRSGPDLYAELIGLLEDLDLEAKENHGAALLKIRNRIKLVRDFADELAAFHGIEGGA